MGTRYKRLKLGLVLGFVIASVLTFQVGQTLASSGSEATPLDPFYGVSSELNDEMESIVLADSRIHDLIKGRTNDFIAGGQVVHDEDYNVSVGVRLKDGVTKEEFEQWILSGRKDAPNLISEYVALLNVGYNDKYEMRVDTTLGQIVDLRELALSRPDVPEASAEEKQRALQIALSDVTVKRLLEVGTYTIAPKGAIGVWHDGGKKLGVSFKIIFDKAYAIDTDLPKYNDTWSHVTGQVQAIIISVLLEENRVALIVPQAPILD